MIQLDEKEHFIAKGTRRHCYRHPDHPDRCIKISPPGEGKQQRREYKYYRSLIRRKVSMEHLAKFHGKVKTNKGTGYVYDLILDHDGSVAAPLRDYLNEEYPDREELIRLIRELKAYLLREGIMFYDMNGNNILCRKGEDGSLHFITIDGIGEVVAIGFLNIFRRHFLRTFERRFPPGERDWIRTLAARTALWLGLQRVRGE